MMAPIRKVQEATHFKYVSAPSRDDPSVMIHDYLTPCSPGDPQAIEMAWTDVPGDKLLEPIINMRDFNAALENQRPSVSKEDLYKHEQFTKEFGLEGV
jgi:vacuolar protein-sorting-associated protein 4